MKPVVGFAVGVVTRLHVDPKGLDQLAVLNAGGTGCFAGPAIEAEFQMPPYMLIQWQAFIGDCPHQVDTAARTVIFVSQFGVGRTSRRAKAAMDTIQEVVVINIGTRVGGGGWHCLRCGVTADRVGGGQGCIRHGLHTILDS